MTDGSLAAKAERTHWFRRAMARRMRQTWLHTTSRKAVTDMPAHLGPMLSTDANARFQSLLPADRRHLIAVANELAREGASDDLVTAGLLHDIGKSLPGIEIRLGDRIAKVLMEVIAPGTLIRIAGRSQPPRRGAAIWVLARHAAAGAAFVAEAGYNERIQWLIAQHERRDTDDADLLRLIAADSGHQARSTR